LLKTFEIVLDIEKDIYSPANILFTASRNDFNSIELQFSLVQDGAAFDLTGKTVEIAIKKPSNLVVYQDVQIVDATGGIAAAQLTIQGYSEFGLHVAEIYIRDAAQMIVTSPFYYFSRESVIDGNYESIDEWSALQKVLFNMDKKPLLTDGVPAVAPEYIGQMAFDTTYKRAFIAFDTIETGWQLMAASEGAGGIVQWADIIGKPAAFPAAAHNHEIADVNGLQAALDAANAPTEPSAPAEHTHEIADVNGLQPALDSKADDADLTTKADVNHTHDFASITDKPLAYPAEAHGHLIAEIDGLQTALDSKANIGEGGGLPDAHTHEIADVNGLQGALDSKADDADLLAKADAVHTHDFASITDKPLAYPAEAHGHTWTEITEKPAAFPAEAHKHDWAEIDGKPLAFPPEAHDHPEYMTQIESDARYALRDAEGGTIQSVDWGTITGDIAAQTDLQAALNGKADDADLIPYITESDADLKYALKADAPIEHGHTISHIEGLQTEIDAINAEIDTKANIIHTHAITDTTGLQAALDSKADDADLLGKADTIHTHEIADVNGLAIALDGKADDSDLLTKADAVHSHSFDSITEKPAAYPPETHNHEIVDVTGLQLALDGKADDADLNTKADTVHRHDWAEIDGKPAVYPAEAHGHAIADVNGLQTALDGKADDADLLTKADTVHTHSYTTLTDIPTAFTPATHTHSIADTTGLQAALDGKADDADLSAKADAVHAHAIADVTGLQTALDGKVDDAELNTLQKRAVVSGSVPEVPSITPEYTGQFVIDSTNKRTFIAAGETTGDWKRLAETTYADTGDNYIINNILGSTKIWTGSQAAYDGITTKDTATLYFIT
jgi:hypothetical protein